MIHTTDSETIVDFFKSLTYNLPNRDSLENTQSIYSVHTTYLHMWLVRCLQTIKQPFFVVCPNDEIALWLYRNLIIFYDSVYFFPSERNPSNAREHDYTTKQNEYERMRIHTLHSLARKHNEPLIKPKEFPLIICSVMSWLSGTICVNDALIRGIRVSVGQELKHELLIQKLIENGYTRVSRVQQKLEFAVRGTVIDICTDIAHKGYRIHVDFGNIEDISEFSLETQMSTSKKHKHIDIVYGSEYCWDNQGIENLEKNINEQFSEVSKKCLDQTIHAIQNEGFHPYQHMFGAHSSTIFSHISDYAPNAYTFFYRYEEGIKAVEQYEREYQKTFFSIHTKVICPRYSRISYIRDKIIQSNIKSSIFISTFKNKFSNESFVNDYSCPAFKGNMDFFAKQCIEYINKKYKIVISCINTRSYARLKALIVPQLERACKANGIMSARIHFVYSSMTLGFLHHAEKILCITEAELLGKSMRFIESQTTDSLVDESSTQKQNSIQIDSLISDLEQLEPGNLLVHINYGIGKYVSLERREFFGIEKEYIKISYAYDESLYVPIEQMSLVHRYIGKNPESVSLDSLGSASWTSRKNKIKKIVEDISQDLLDTQAKRQTTKGISFIGGEQLEHEFLNDFEYSDTADQYSAWLEIKQDMEQPNPMDRLVVGDVGFGKTELAFRAAFKAMCAHMQVLFLVPTTILAEQHYERARLRYKKWPMTIDILTRFRTQSEARRIVKGTKEGTIDLLVATHRALRSTLEFKTIGLVIIDEEHRFGVKDKELLKKQYPFVDVLSMSATPIPRTLQQSLFSMRQLSLIKTPPRKRKPIITHVEKFSPKLIQSAIRTELHRGGQVFFLHNRIDSLQEIKEFIETLVEEATIITLNGKMQANQIEDGMRRFVQGGANILVSTTIIENGIDIPNVNTIIINWANNYGISQLYQLRGRVGRSDRSAHAYLLYQNELSLSSIAVKRLTTISEHTELGAGFEVARTDLEVRGAGNLLGKEQSGNMQSIGYQYYLQLLDAAVKKKKEIPQVSESVELDLDYSGYIPVSYIPDAGTRMSTYKKITSIDSVQAIQVIEKELNDMFGTIPLEIENLMFISHIRVLARRLHIESIKKTVSTKKVSEGIEITFSNVGLLNHVRASVLMSENKIQKGSQPNKIVIPYQVFTKENTKKNNSSTTMSNSMGEKGTNKTYTLKYIYAMLSEILEQLQDEHH